MDQSWPTVLDDVTAALETLTATLATEDDFTVLLTRMCEQVVTAVPGVDEATITLLADHHPSTVASTSEIVTKLDQDQYTAGGGPCVRAAETGELVRASLTHAVQEWPVFGRDAEAAGFDSFLSAPLVVADGYSGAVNCYGGQGKGFADLDEKLLGLYTGVVTATLRVYSRYQYARDTAEQLRAALGARAVIDQAKGILMTIRQISADEAFVLLVAQSQRENVKLRDVAVRFVDHATGPVRTGD